MTQALHRRAGEIFLAALEREGAAREELVAEACGDDRELLRLVETLLAADPTGTSALDRAPALPVSGRGPLAAAEAPPAAIGAYRVLREIGRGGMGCVYLAERADAEFRQQVAIKVVHPGLASAAVVQRFKSERQILANLDHPNIARLLDGGSLPDGRPYLVMEHVEGERIDAHCDRRALPIDERLRLFCAACSAVQVAHQSLVVHRDLKPSNILVTADGRPKLLDFGIAKLLEPERADFTVARTRTDEVLMTPEYASPEQVRGEPITTASDVYSLGVILYRLLTGHSPYRLSEPTPLAIQGAIRDQDPPRPSSAATDERPSTGSTTALERARHRGTRPERLRRRLSGDLDNIVLAALRKEPRRRYASAAQLAEDIERHLAGRPVSARPDTWGYRTRKFCRRNRLAVSAVVLLVLALLLFGVTSARQARSLERERNLAKAQAAKAELEAETSRTVADFLAELFEGANPVEAGGAGLTAAELLDRARLRADRLEGRTEIQARLFDTIGRSYQFLGLGQRAEPLLERAAALSESLYGPDSKQVAEPLHRVARLRMDAGDLDGSIALYERVLAIHLAHQPENDVKVAESHNNLSAPLFDAGRFAEAEEHMRAALSIHADLGPAAPPERAIVLANAAFQAFQLGRVPDALRLVEEARREADRLANNPYRQAGVLMTLANITKQVGRHRESEELLQGALEQAGELWGEQSDIHLDLLENLAYAKEYSGKYVEAIELLERALAVARARGSEGRLPALLSDLANVLRTEGRLSEAEERLNEALEIAERRQSGTSFESARALSILGLVHSKRGDFAAGESCVLEALAMVEELGLERTPGAANFLERVGQHYQMAGDEEAALEYLSRALAVNLALFGETGDTVAIVRGRLAELHRAAGRTAEAERLLQAALAGLEEGGANPDDLASALLQYGRLLRLDLGRPAEAEPLLRRALDLRRTGATERTLASTGLELTACLIQLRRPDEASAQLDDLLARLPDLARGDSEPARRFLALRGEIDGQSTRRE